MEISKSKTLVYASLSSKKMRNKHGLFVVEGEKCVLDMLGAFRLESVVALPEWMDAHKNSIPVDSSKMLTASRDAISKISSLSTSPDVLAVMHLPEAEHEDSFFLPKDSLSLLIDGIQDPGNLGTIIRTADWFGFKTVYASHDTVDIFNPKTIQSTMGSLKRVFVRYCNLPDLIERSKTENVYGTLLDGKDIYGAELSNHGAIIMGNEGKGISESLRKHINRPLLIPPYDKNSHAESLNVAVATGIVLSIFRTNKN